MLVVCTSVYVEFLSQYFIVLKCPFTKGLRPLFTEKNKTLFFLLFFEGANALENWLVFVA